MSSCETIHLIDGLGYLRFQYLFDSSNAIFVEQRKKGNWIIFDIFDLFNVSLIWIFNFMPDCHSYTHTTIYTNLPYAATLSPETQTK